MKLIMITAALLLAAAGPIAAQEAPVLRLTHAEDRITRIQTRGPPYDRDSAPRQGEHSRFRGGGFRVLASHRRGPTSPSSSRLPKGSRPTWR